MPRSKNPESYPSVFPRLLELFAEGVDRQTFKLANAAQALQLRSDFYAYRKALQLAAEAAEKRKDTATQTHYNSHYRIALQYKVRFDPILPRKNSLPLADYELRLASPTTVIFENVHVSPYNLRLLKQLEEPEPSPEPSPNSPTDFTSFLKKQGWT